MLCERRRLTKPWNLMESLYLVIIIITEHFRTCKKIMQFQTVLCLYVPDLVYCGRILHDDVSLASCGLASGSIVLALKKTPSLKPSSEHGIS